MTRTCQLYPETFLETFVYALLFSFLKNTDPDIECFMGVILMLLAFLRVSRIELTNLQLPTGLIRSPKDRTVNKDKVKEKAKIQFWLVEDKQFKWERSTKVYYYNNFFKYPLKSQPSQVYIFICSFYWQVCQQCNLPCCSWPKLLNPDQRFRLFLWSTVVSHHFLCHWSDSLENAPGHRCVQPEHIFYGQTERPRAVGCSSLIAPWSACVVGKCVSGCCCSKVLSAWSSESKRESAAPLKK